MVSPWMQHGSILNHIADVGGPKIAKIRRYVGLLLIENGMWLSLTDIFSFPRSLKVWNIFTRAISYTATFVA